MPAVVKVADLTEGLTSAAVAAIDIDRPANIAVGDVLVAMLHNQASATTGSDTSKAWQCSGWTLVGPNPHFYADARNRISNFLYLIVTAANIGTLPVSWHFTEAFGTGRAVGQIVAISGLDLDDLLGGQTWSPNPTDVGAGYGATIAPNMSASYYPTVDPPYSITFTPGVPLLGLCFHYGQFTTGNINGVTTDMPDWVKIRETDSSGVTTVSRSNMVSYYRRFDGTVLKPLARTMQWQAATVASLSSLECFFKEKTTSHDSGAGIPVRRVEAGPTLAPHRVRVMEPAGLTTPRIRQVKPSPVANVTALLAKPNFVVAHRGGSLDWPEMSQYGYLRSATYGVDALEISLAKSSDGVIFGLHDSSLDRTSLGTGGGSGTTLMAASMTWAQIQTYSILASGTNNPSQVNRPYARFTDLLNQFAKQHIIFIDPKVIPANQYSSIIDIMDSYGGPARFVGKYYGISGGAANAPGGWARSLSDRGYQSWGYFYDTDSANYALYQDRWSILGLNYTANQPYWDSLKTYGKRIIAHICPDANAAATGMAKGATATMASGVAEVMGVAHDIVAPLPL